jgi:hypothetical protein
MAREAFSAVKGEFMKQKTDWLRRILAGTFVFTVVMLATPCFAQDHKGSTHATKSKSATPQRRTTSAKTGHTGVPATHRTSTPRTNKARSGTGVRTTTTARNSGGHTQSTQRSSSNSRPMRIQSGVAVQASTWRGSHPSWNGGYFYRGGSYYYDSSFSYPAIMVNEWSEIAVLAGGVALLGAIDNDPTLVFVGTVGALYSYSQYASDQGSSNQSYRLRADFFGKSYFWRNGVRYDRISVTSGGVNYYRFQRH